FLLCYGHNCDLHSFPTRRSSDLATINMSGTALYEGCVVLFIAQVYGVDLSVAQQLMLLLLSVLSAVAVAGIPGGSLPLIAGLLRSEEHTSELQSRENLVCRLLLE